jgi:hypothetical protein
MHACKCSTQRCSLTLLMFWNFLRKVIKEEESLTRLVGWQGTIFSFFISIPTWPKRIYNAKSDLFCVINVIFLLWSVEYFYCHVTMCNLRWQKGWSFNPLLLLLIKSQVFVMKILMSLISLKGVVFSFILIGIKQIWGKC